MMDLAKVSGEGPGSCEALRALYQISDDDVDRIRAYGNTMRPRSAEFVDHFYNWLSKTPEFSDFFSGASLLEGVKRKQVQYWDEFWLADLNDDYIDRCYRLGQVHARIGLPLPVYFGAMARSLTICMESLYDNQLSDAEFALTVRSVTKLMQLDTAVVTQTFAEITQATIREQTDSLMAMSTPVTAVWDDILLLPLVGLIDSRRAHEIMTSTLSAIGKTQAKVLIMDISGVAVVDTAVANYLIKITRAARLMGCQCIVSGVSPAIAQTIVELGIDVGSVETTATLKVALARGFALANAANDLAHAASS